MMLFYYYQAFILRHSMQDLSVAVCKKVFKVVNYSTAYQERLSETEQHEWMKRRSDVNENKTATQRNTMLISGCVMVNTFQSTRRILSEGATLPNFVQIQPKCTFYPVGCEQFHRSCSREGRKSTGLQHKTSCSSY